MFVCRILSHILCVKVEWWWIEQTALQVSLPTYDTPSQLRFAECSLDEQPPHFAQLVCKLEKGGKKDITIVCRLSSSMCGKHFSHSVAKATSSVPERKSASFVSKMSQRSEMSLGIENWVISHEWPATKSNFLASRLHKYHIFQLVCHIAAHCIWLCLSDKHV